MVRTSVFRFIVLAILCFSFAFAPAQKASAEEYDISTLDMGIGGSPGYMSAYSGYASDGQQRVAHYYDASNNQDIVYVVAGERGTGRYSSSQYIYLYKSINGGTTFSKKTRVHPWFGRYPSMAVGADGTIYVVFNRGSGIYFTKSTDGGESFSPAIRIGGEKLSPIIRLDDNGHIHVVYADSFYSLLTNVWYAKSTNGGASFTTKKIIGYNYPAFSGYKRNMNFEIDNNGGKMYFAWVSTFSGSSVHKVIFAKSEDEGNTFSTKIMESYPSRLVDVYLKKKEDGSLYLLWNRLGASGADIVLSKSGDFGQTFSAPATVVQGVPMVSGCDARKCSQPAQTFPTMEIDGKGDIYVAWAQYAGHLNAESFFARSTDDGATFGDPVGTIPGLFPRIALDGTGNVYIWTAKWQRYLASRMYFSVATPLITMLPPENVAAADTGCDNGGSLTVTWTLSPDDPAVGGGRDTVTGYNLYRADMAGGAYALLGTVPAGIATYEDFPLTDGNSYSYIVRATDGTKESEDSNESSASSARNLPLPPAGVAAADTPYDLGGSIDLSWATSPDDGGGLNNVAGYNVYRYSASNGTIVSLTSLTPGSTGYVDNTTLDTDTYFYFLKAADSVCSLESPSSTIAEGQSVNNLEVLGDVIGDMPGIPANSVNSLTQKADNALASLDKGNEGAAVNKLEALLNEVNALFTSGRIDAATRDALAAYIGGLVDYIGSL